MGTNNDRLSRSRCFPVSCCLACSMPLNHTPSEIRGQTWRQSCSPTYWESWQDLRLRGSRQRSSPWGSRPRPRRCLHRRYWYVNSSWCCCNDTFVFLYVCVYLLVFKSFHKRIRLIAVNFSSITISDPPCCFSTSLILQELTAMYGLELVPVMERKLTVSPTPPRTLPTHPIPSVLSPCWSRRPTCPASRIPSEKNKHLGS